MLKHLYDRTLALAGHPRAPLWLAIISFAESSFFPIPPDVLLLPMCLARRDRAWRLALICTVASVAGGVVGYAIGFYLFDAVAQPIFAAYGKPDALATFQHWYDQWGLLLILVKGMTPIPYKIVTITSGFAGYDLPLFILFSMIARGGRFFILAFLLHRYGDRARHIIEERLGFWVTLAAVAMVIGIAAAMYLF